MSFVFPSWPTAFSPEFHESAKATLETALNKGNKPPVIQGRIEVVELCMGKEPPTLTLLEIGDLSLDRFRGILRLGYQGDAWLEVRCRVQANPLSHNPNLNPGSSILPLSTPLLASQPLLVPMTLRLSKLHLRAILILVVSASKGITLVFKNDPLQNVDVSSTFDSVEVIRGYLQQEIEGQLREMFREDLPGIIHRLSQRWFTGAGVGGKVEMPYRDPVDVGPPTGQLREDEARRIEDDEMWSERPLFPPHTPLSGPPAPQNTPISISPRKRTTSGQKSRRASGAISESPTSYTTFPDIEDYDPTYGLRPEGVPTHSGYEAFGRLWEKSREGGGRGLGSLMGLGRVEEDRGDVSDGEWDEPEMDSLNLVDVDDAMRYGNQSTSTRDPGTADEDIVEWETFPAVGGGVITRPRVFHAQSQIKVPSELGGAMPSPSGTATGGSVTARASSVGEASSTIGSLRLAPHTPLAGASRQYRPNPNRASSLRRVVTSRSDVFVTQQPRPSSIAGMPVSSSFRTLRPPTYSDPTKASSVTHARSSWDTDHPQMLNAAMSSSKSQSLHTPPSAPASLLPLHSRSPSNATNLTGSFPPRSFIGPNGITLPLNNSVSQLASLSHSAHTLSPYARTHEHIAVRSFPHLGKSSSLANTSVTTTSADAISSGAVKAHRKRIFNLNKSGESSPLASQLDKSHTAPTSPSALPHRLPRSQSTSPKAVSADLPSAPTHLAFGRWKPASLTGLANKVMNEDGALPKPPFLRLDSRRSYGFPPPSSYRE